MSQPCSCVLPAYPWWLRQNGRSYWLVALIVILVVIMLMGWTPEEILQLLSLLHSAR